MHAPSKKLIWFERSAHNVPFEEPERFDATLLDLRKSIPSGGENPEGAR